MEFASEPSTCHEMTLGLAASPVSRTLLALERSSASGELRLLAREGRARFRLVEGRVVRIDVESAGDEPDTSRLGPILVRHGVVTRAVLEAAVASSDALGASLLSAKACSEGALGYALRAQLKARFRRVTSWGMARVHWTRGRPSLPGLLLPMSGAELVLDSLRAHARERSLLCLVGALGTQTMQLTAAGESLARAPLWPDEIIALDALRAGANAERILERTRHSERVMGLVAGLKHIEAISPRSGAPVLPLLGKIRQVRRARPAHELLHVSRDAAPEQARRALRRWAVSLHPDRFGADCPAGLRRASHEVMGALNGASALFSRTPPMGMGVGERTG